MTDGQPAALSLAPFLYVPLCFHFPPIYYYFQCSLSTTQLVGVGERYICSSLFTRELKFTSDILELRSKNLGSFSGSVNGGCLYRRRKTEVLGGGLVSQIGSATQHPILDYGNYSRAKERSPELTSAQGGARCASPSAQALRLIRTWSENVVGGEYADYRFHFLGLPFSPLGWGPEMGQRHLAQNLSLVA